MAAEEFLQNLLTAVAAQAARFGPGEEGGAVRERHADVRGLGRPSEFDGRADQWTEWSFRAKAWIVLNTEFGTVDLEKVSRSAGPVDMRAMGATARTMEANAKL